MLDVGLVRLQRRPRASKRAHRPPAARCTPTSARRSRRSTPATSPPRSACATRTTGDTLCDEDQPIVLERSSSRSRSSRSPSSRRRRPTRRSSASALAEARQRGSVVPRVDRRRDRPDDHLRHGRAAPRDHRRPPDARVQGRGQRRQAAGRLPRDDPQDGRARDASFVRQTGGRGQYGHVMLRVEPQPSRASGFEFVDEHQGRRRSRASTSRPVEKGINEALDARRPRRLPGRRRQGRRCIDGSYHEVDSSEMAFKIAGSMALQGGRAARPTRSCSSRSCRVEVVDPEEFMGDVIGDLDRRRGRINGHGAARRRAGHQRRRCRWRRCSATRPTCARTTQGRATYTMQFSHYEPVPKGIGPEADPPRRRPGRRAPAG